MRRRRLEGLRVSHTGLGARPAWAALAALLVAIAPACSSNRDQQPVEDVEDDNDTSVGDDDTSIGGDDDGIPGPDLNVVLLSPTEQLVRASMALRGLRPSVEDLEAVQKDPTQLASRVDSYLESEAFGETIRDMYAEALLVRTADAVAFAVRLPPVGLLSNYSMAEIHRAISEAPLKLVERVVLEDLPFGDILAADWLLTDEINSIAWGLDYDPEGPEWQLANWTDGRPPAGLLNSPALWARWVNNSVNHQRGRANMVSTAFLCDDFFARDVPAHDSTVLTTDEFADAVSTNPVCTGCHQSLDPLASFFWGFRGKLLFRDVLVGHEHCDVEEEFDPGISAAGANCYPLATYFPEGVDRWQQNEMPPPAFFGTPGEDLGDLARLISEDPRFSLCTTRRFLGYFHQTAPENVPFEAAAAYQDRFVLGDKAAGVLPMRGKALARSIVLSEDFQTSHVLSEESDRPSQARLLVIRPRQLSRMVEDLTGFVWNVTPDDPSEPCLDPVFSDSFEVQWGCWGSIDMTASAVFGLRSVAGGIDAYHVITPTRTPTTGRNLLIERLADEAAAFVATRDFAESDFNNRRLLRFVGADTTEEVQIKAQLTFLHRRILSEWVEADSAEVVASFALYQELLTSVDGNTSKAWSLVISAFLQDSRLNLY